MRGITIGSCFLLIFLDRQRPSKNPQARSPRIEKIDERSRSESKQNYSNRARSPSTQRTIGGSPSWSLRNSYSLLVDIEESQASSGIAFPEPEVPRDSDLRTPDQWEIPEQILQKRIVIDASASSKLIHSRCNFQQHDCLPFDLASYGHRSWFSDAYGRRQDQHLE